MNFSTNNTKSAVILRPILLDVNDRLFKYLAMSLNLNNQFLKITNLQKKTNQLIRCRLYNDNEIY